MLLIFEMKLNFALVVYGNNLKVRQDCPIAREAIARHERVRAAEVAGSSANVSAKRWRKQGQSPGP